MRSAQGVNGIVTCDGRFVTLSPPKGLLGGMKARGAGERRFALKSISMVEYSAPTRMKNGYIRFVTGGLQPLQGSPTRPAFMEAMNDANSIVFASKHEKSMSAIRDEIDLAIADL